MKNRLLITIIVIVVILIISMVCFYLFKESPATSNIFNKTDIFSKHDLEQSIDTTNATKMELTNNENINITKEGTYVISGTASNTTIFIEASDDDKIELVLNGINITNQDVPCIYVKSADKVFINTQQESSLIVNGTFKKDGNTSPDGAIFSKSDITLKGTAKLTITSSNNGVVSKDDVKITSGSYIITATSKGIEANDSIAISDGTITIKAGTDGLHAEYDKDDTVGYIYIGGGAISIDVNDDGLHATSFVQIDDGTITINAKEGIEGTYIVINNGTISINAKDDGINASHKSAKYQVKVEINGGTISINMADGDTDAIDSNGDLLITGGNISIVAKTPFDYDGTGRKTGGRIIVNGNQIDSLTNQMIGGPKDHQKKK